MTKDDKDRVLKDGEGIVVSMMAMDSVQRQIAKRNLVTDAFGRPAGSAPGYLFTGDTAVKRAAQAAREWRMGHAAASWCV